MFGRLGEYLLNGEMASWYPCIKGKAQLQNAAAIGHHSSFCSWKGICPSRSNPYWTFVSLEQKTSTIRFYARSFYLGCNLGSVSDLHREFNRLLYVAYVDLKSAFDSVDRELLWKALRGISTPTLILSLIQDLYSSIHSKVWLGTNLSDSFQTRSGLIQGCVLAPRYSVEP